MGYKAFKFEPLAGCVLSSMFVDLQPGGAYIFINVETNAGASLKAEDLTHVPSKKDRGGDLPVDSQA